MTGTVSMSREQIEDLIAKSCDALVEKQDRIAELEAQLASERADRIKYIESLNAENDRQEGEIQQMRAINKELVEALRDIGGQLLTSEDDPFGDYHLAYDLMIKAARTVLSKTGFLDLGDSHAQDSTKLSSG